MRGAARGAAVEQAAEANQLVQQVEPVGRVPEHLSDVAQMICGDEPAKRDPHLDARTELTQRVSQRHLPGMRNKPFPIFKLYQRQSSRFTQPLRLNALTQPEEQLRHRQSRKHQTLVARM